MMFFFFCLFLLMAVMLIAQGKLKRWIGYQLLLFLSVIFVTASLTVVIDTGLFGAANTILWNPQYFFILIHAQDDTIFFALFMVVALIGWGYCLYLSKYVFHFGNSLGKARFANAWDLYQAGFFPKHSRHGEKDHGGAIQKARNQSGTGFVLGKSHYGLLRYTGYEPMIFVSGTGGGKSTAVVIPNCFELKNENLVITDIKGEIYEKTAGFRQSIGNAVFRLEPSAENTHRYNPLGWLRKTHLDEDIDVVLKVLIPDSHDPLWADGSRNVAKMLILYFLFEKKITPTLQLIYETIVRPTFDEEMQLLYETLPEASPTETKQSEKKQIKNLLGKFLSAREKTRKDFLLSAQEYLSMFDSPKLAYATSANDFDARDLRTKPMTIYFILPANSTTYNTLAAIFFEQIIRLTTGKNKPDASEYAITVLIDEFANLPKMPSLAKGITFLRSYRIRICAFVQNIAQLKAIYGEEQKEGFISAPLKVAFNITSYQDAKYFSDLAGQKTIHVQSHSLSHELHLSTSNHQQLRPLLRPEEIMRLSANKMLIFKTGFPVAKARKNFWFKDGKYHYN